MKHVLDQVLGLITPRDEIILHTHCGIAPYIFTNINMITLHSDMYTGTISTHNSYLPVIGMHEMHGRMHQTILLVVDLCSSLAYFMMTQPLPIAGKLPIKNFGC